MRGNHEGERCLYCVQSKQSFAPLVSGHRYFDCKQQNPEQKAIKNDSTIVTRLLLEGVGHQANLAAQVSSSAARAKILDILQLLFDNQDLTHNGPIQLHSLALTLQYFPQVFFFLTKLATSGGLLVPGAFYTHTPTPHFLSRLLNFRSDKPCSKHTLHTIRGRHSSDSGRRRSSITFLKRC